MRTIEELPACDCGATAEGDWAHYHTSTCARFKACQITDLDRAWERINALGGTGYGDWQGGSEEALGRALNTIEELGGCDPLVKAAALRVEAKITSLPFLGKLNVDNPSDPINKQTLA